MVCYVQELPALIATHFPQLDTNNTSITGHSMGGHGALTIALKNPGMFKSVSAFAPICNPCDVPWGTKAFTGYFGELAELHWACVMVIVGLQSFSKWHPSATPVKRRWALKHNTKNYLSEDLKAPATAVSCRILLSALKVLGSARRP